mgnify:CR=1 FL=1
MSTEHAPPTLTPKQAEIRSRESRILNLALPMVAGGGFAALSMDAIAKEMAYAKGTIYNHFSCKEEILLALAIEANETRLRLFHLAADRLPRSRDKVGGVGIGWYRSCSCYAAGITWCYAEYVVVCEVILMYIIMFR